MAKWHKSKVLRGKKLGRKLGFSTVNLDPALWPVSYKEGVYACLVKYENITYKGALYYGPRLVLKETSNVLEIYIIDFKKNLYDQEILWQINAFIREKKNFSSLEDLKSQLKKDVEDIRSIR